MLRELCFELKNDFMEDVEFFKEIKKSATLADVAETILLFLGFSLLLMISSIFFLIIL